MPCGPHPRAAASQAFETFPGCPAESSQAAPSVSGLPSALRSPPSTDRPPVSGSAPPQVRGELLRERLQQLEAQEGRFAESLVSLQFQKAARMTKTLWAYTALLSVQDLLLEELSESETLTRSACVQILESHSSVSVCGGGAGLRGVGAEPAGRGGGASRCGAEPAGRGAEPARCGTEPAGCGACAVWGGACTVRAEPARCGGGACWCGKETARCGGGACGA